MTTENYMIPAFYANKYVCNPVARNNATKYLKVVLNDDRPLYAQRRAELKGPAYRYIEYLSSPHGFILLAHQDTVDGQIDGIHPSSISGSIQREINIIEPVPGGDIANVTYSRHWMWRKSQGSLILEAFGRMIEQATPESPYLETEGRFRLDIYGRHDGAVVAVYDTADAANIHVIEPIPVAEGRAAA